MSSFEGLEGLVSVPVGLIDPSPDQNREEFDPARLRELADSIAETGLLQPLSVRVSVSGSLVDTETRYTLVAGERRLRAVRDVLSWETVPCIVRQPADQLAAAIGTLVENTARVDLQPLEDARGLAHALELGATPAELAQKMGKGIRWVRDRLSLLSLADDVAHYLGAGLSIEKGVLMSGLDVNRQRLALQAHEHGIGVDAFKALCARLGDEQAAESMFDAASFLKVDEYVIEAEQAVAPEPPIVVFEMPIGMREIAELLEVKYQTVKEWRQRHIFPEPAGKCGGAPVWRETVVREWAEATGR